jgi:DNA-binding response OmpR family regulator/glycine cleavage system H lipoate-binding protein
MNYQPSILVIDDEALICESCDRIFSQAGYKVDTNINPDNGLRQALINNYDAIVLDLKLGEKDGLELLRGIREKKPKVPVLIITGYPTRESREMSTELGALEYILKPFEPAELLEPVQRITFMEPAVSYKTIYPQEDIKPGTHYRFFESSWFYQGLDGLIRVGGHLSNLLNTKIESITLPEIGSTIYMGLPLAEVTLDNNFKQIIPSAICGKITDVNTNLKEHPSILEKSINKESWIAIIKPENLEKDIKASEIRKILLLGKESSKENRYLNQFTQMGYLTITAKSIDKAIELINKEKIKVVVLDAITFMDNGPEYVKRIKKECNITKIIGLNNPNSKFEILYRENRMFYYGVNPISNQEMADVLNCAFWDKRKSEIPKSNELSLLPKTISKIRITNRYSKKVTLLAYDDILQNNQGIGYLLIKNLIERSYPIEAVHCRSRKSLSDTAEIQNILNEKEKNDRIIIVHTQNLKMIPGGIIKKTEEFKNSSGADNLITTISIQPAVSNKKIFDNITTRSLADLITNEMTSDLKINSKL